MSDQLIKKRKIAIDRVNDKLNVYEIRTRLKNIEGIIAVGLDEERRDIKIEYDLWKINFETIEKFLEEFGLGLSQKIAERIKRGMAKFTEQNELDNLTAKPVSCGLCSNEGCHKRMNGGSLD